jgi:hypothetical protein
MKAVTTLLAPPSRNFRRFAAVLCLGLFLALQVLAVSDSLHHSLHADAAAPGHSCVISALTQGQFNAPEFTGMLILAVFGFLFALPVFYFAALSSFDHRLTPSRGPPCL